jgi:hypothetical protein
MLSLSRSRDVVALAGAENPTLHATEAQGGERAPVPTSTVNVHRYFWINYVDIDEN